MREKFNQQLLLLHEALIEMGQMCEQAISMAIQALTDSDESLVEKVFDVDSGIDKKEREIENLCLKLLLQQQPIATDLRDISAALKMISDMERIGDQASDIAELSEYFISHKHSIEDNVREMSAEVIKMVTDSVDAYVKRDLELARAVIAHDDVVDDWFCRIKADVIRLIAGDNTKGEYYVDLMMVTKYLERIADHATNIAEWVEYSITGARSKNGVVLPQEE